MLFFPLPPFFPWKGATIKKDEQTGAIIVARIMRGGAADRSGENQPLYSLNKDIMYVPIVTVLGRWSPQTNVWPDLGVLHTIRRPILNDR